GATPASTTPRLTLPAYGASWVKSSHSICWPRTAFPSIRLCSSVWTSMPGWSLSMRSTSARGQATPLIWRTASSGHGDCARRHDTHNTHKNSEDAPFRGRSRAETAILAAREHTEHPTKQRDPPDPQPGAPGDDGNYHAQ